MAEIAHGGQVGQAGPPLEGMQQALHCRDKFGILLIVRPVVNKLITFIEDLRGLFNKNTQQLFIIITGCTRPGRFLSLFDWL